MHQDFAQVWVPALAYTQQAGLASGGVLPSVVDAHSLIPPRQRKHCYEIKWKVTHGNQ